MNRSTLRFAAILFAGCCLAAGFAFANSHDKDNAKTAAAPAAPDMEMMMKLAAPGPQHEVLKQYVGEWKTTTKMYTGPGEPTVAQGATEFQMVLGDRYLEERATGTFGDMPFEGRGITGYDNAKKAYVFSWIDNMGTGLMTGTGSYDAAKKVMTFKVSGTGPDGKPATYRSTIAWVDASTCVYTMYLDVKGKEQKMMETTYIRS